MDYTPRDRADALKAATRHTARVRFLRRAIPMGAVLGVTVVGLVGFLNPFRRLPGSVSVASVGVSGTKVTLDSPRIQGLQDGGGSYEIKARTGVQDITVPNVIDLFGVDARVGMADHTTTRILSRNGTYDSKADTMSLTGAVRISNTGGYSFDLKSALMDFRSGLFTSHERLRVDIDGGKVLADDMTISNKGQSIAFRGNVVSSFDSPFDADGPGDEGARGPDVDGAPSPRGEPPTREPSIRDGAERRVGGPSVSPTGDPKFGHVRQGAFVSGRSTAQGTGAAR